MKPAIQPSARNFFARALGVAAVCPTLFCVNHAALSAAATNRPAVKGPTDRYLLIVDTSAAMERNAENTQRLVSQLLTTGMVGQARPGDTIGLWTFNEELRTGGFPLQRWTPQTRERIASAAVEFLGKHRYEKRARFENVADTLASVVKDSEKITVLIITDGTEKISGTPFDQEINESYRLNYDVQRKQRMPFMAVLRARGGEFVGWRVNTPPFRPEFPDFPTDTIAAKPPETAAEPKPELKPESKPEPSTSAPPLIVVGEAPKPVPSTNSPTPDATQPAVTQTPDQPQQPKADIQPTAPVETPATQTTTGATTDVATKPPVIESPLPKSDVPKPAEPTESTASTSQATPATEPGVSAVPVQTAVATPAQSLFNRTNLLIGGAVLLVTAFGLLYLVMRRAARPAEKVSLITRSMDRDQDNP